MTDGPYRDYVRRLAEHVEKALAEIQAEYNFEYGDEFEVAVCQILRAALPDSYGICRGYVTTMSGDVAGDDVIIYERSRFPTLRLHREDDYSRKEYIPIEAVYAYIEAKFTLNLFGNDGQSLRKAARQVSAVKKLVSTREPFSAAQFDAYVPAEALGIDLVADHLPTSRNPPYVAIFAGGARLSKRKPRTFDFAEIRAGIDAAAVSADPAPDLIVVGADFVSLPVLAASSGEMATFASPFFLEGKSTYKAFDASGAAFGVALATLMAALDWIRLGRMPWYDVLSVALGIKPQVSPPN